MMLSDLCKNADLLDLELTTNRNPSQKIIKQVIVFIMDIILSF